MCGPPQEVAASGHGDGPGGCSGATGLSSAPRGAGASAEAELLPGTPTPSVHAEPLSAVLKAGGGRTADAREKRRGAALTGAVGARSRGSRCSRRRAAASRVRRPPAERASAGERV